VDEAELAVDAAIAWHDSWVRAFGLRTETDADAWRLLDAGAPPFYFTAITRRPEAPPEALAQAHGTVCDGWAQLDLEPYGFEPRGGEPWYFRPPGPLEPEDAPAELELVRATTPEEIEEFEAVSLRGFGSEGDDVVAGSAHPATVLADPRMTCWFGRVDGRPVAAAMSFETDGAIGIFGVTTVASARRHGYGTAITRAAILPESGLPAVLAPSPEAESLYQRLGFRTVGELRKWWRA
jgi:Acetyltransferase (GNAT) family